jgi:hypothetical protein
LEAQKIANSQGNTEQKKQNRRHHKILQSQSNKNSMALAQKQV